MARTTDERGVRPVKIIIRKKTLKQIVGSGGGVAPSVAKLIGHTDKNDGKDAGPGTRAAVRDYRDYLRT